MAVDTRQKRMSIMGMRNHALRGTTIPLFEADSTVDLDDRQHLLGTYSGIAFAAAGWDYELPAWINFNCPWKMPFLPDDSSTISSEDLQEMLWHPRVPTYGAAASGTILPQIIAAYYQRGRTYVN